MKKILPLLLMALLFSACASDYWKKPNDEEYKKMKDEVDIPTPTEIRDHL